jgi:hypothetical protein
VVQGKDWETIEVLVGSDDPKRVEFRGKSLAECGEDQDLPFDGALHKLQTLYRTKDGQLVVHIEEIYEPPLTQMGGTTEHRYQLIKVEESDLTGAGHFAELGLKAGLGRPLTLDEGLAYSEKSADNSA